MIGLKQYIDDNIPVEVLITVGFLRKDDTYEIIAKRVCRLFGIKSIYDYSKIMEEKQEIPINPSFEAFSEN